MRPIIYYT
ncbi:hypothetical protein F383_27255 [Gossypium arboreum]|uniref:Uncharacterized protein n=1 Tax=Gossypium arboreum TaxID=29729 RepID=A0A0B0PGF3_GOSAR|nr:hypothetical protein F383_27255 [Gossypium arboreum]